QFRVNPITGQILNANITVDANLVRGFKLERKQVVVPSAYFEAEIERENALLNPTLQTALALQHDPRRCDMAQEAMREAWYGLTVLKFAGLLGAQISEKDYINQFLRYVVAHEFGHCLGLRHNFIASTMSGMDDLQNPQKVDTVGTAASVMDY